MPSELRSLPLLSAIYIETLIAYHLNNSDESNTLLIALNLASGSEDPFIIALSKIAVHKLGLFGIKQVPDGF